MNVQTYSGPVRTLYFVDGARQARGLTVIIDVFRALSLEAYLLDMGAAEVRPVGSIEELLRLHEKMPDSLLVGEREGIMLKGFDYGNSPSSIPRQAAEGRVILHTTSAGTQGIVNAVDADEILGGSFVTAKAIARYILRTQPESVSLVAMGGEGGEDDLCAEYIRSLLLDTPLPDLDARIAELQNTEGRKFFLPENQKDFPEQDFWMCTVRDCFDFVVRIEKDAEGFLSRKVPV